jgi:hypothetical protein
MISDKINDLKYYLVSKGYSHNEVEDIVQEATQEIDSEVRSLVADALSQAENAADSMQATEFLDHIDLDTSSGYIRISTDNGQLDFSTPPVPMLPWLLKGAKTSKAGNQYRVVPIGKSEGYSVSTKDVDSGIASVKNGASIADVTAGIAQSFGLSSNKIQRKLKDPSPASAFRTASTSQEGTGAWMKKATEKDMRPAIDDINHQLRSKIEEVCVNVTNRYRSR